MLNAKKSISIFDGYNDLVDVSNKYAYCFENTGLMKKEIIYTIKSNPISKIQSH